MKPIQYKQMSMAQEKKICINMLNYKLCDYLMEIGFSSSFHHKAMPLFNSVGPCT